MINRRGILRALGAGPLAATLPDLLSATPLSKVKSRGSLVVGLYKDMPPFHADGAGIDVELGRALAESLGVAFSPLPFPADENMGDDLRNMVWKGHYLGTQPADLMMHVPVDAHLARANDKVRIFGAYHREALGVARDPARIQALSGSAAVALEIFTREKIGVETATLADSFLLGVLNGRLRENVVHFRNVGEAAKALERGEVAAVLAPRAELEAALAGQSKLPVEPAALAELKVGGWPLGMAVKVEEVALADAIAAALADLKREGVVADIFRRNGITYQAA